jgi:hypothetical protein
MFMAVMFLTGTGITINTLGFTYITFGQDDGNYFSKLTSHQFR